MWMAKRNVWRKYRYNSISEICKLSIGLYFVCGGQMTETLAIVVGQAVTERKVSLFNDDLTFTIMICY
jgi:hypothetical protein